MTKHSEFFDSIAQQVRQHMDDGHITGAERSKALRELFDAVSATTCGEAESVTTIESPNALVELIDSKTGHLYRRYLELEYFENDNGIRLAGEDMAGNEAHIVYISETAIKKLHDLRGKGLDEPRCDHE